MTQDLWPFLLLFALTGLVFGSFGSVLATRIPAGDSIGGRSQCPHCKRTLGVIDLIPVLSFLALRGRCRKCNAKIGWSYLLLEVASGLLFVTAFALSSFEPLPAVFLALGFWILFLIAFVDARTQSIPDLFLYALIFAGIGLCLVRRDIDVVSPLIGIAFFGAQWAWSRGKWVGSGDIWLAAGMGLLLPDYRHMIVAILLSYICGAVYASALLLTGKRTRKDHLAFAPFLALGTLASFLFAERILMGI